MTALDDRLEQAGADIRGAVVLNEYADGGVMRRRQHRRTTLFSAAVLTGVVALGVSAVQILPTSDTTESQSASGQTSELLAYGANLPAPWLPGGVAHDEGAYDVPYWETYYYLPTADGAHTAVIARITTRQIVATVTEPADDFSISENGSPSADVVNSRDYSVSVDQGNYTYLWNEGPNTLIELVVIQMAPSAVDEQLSTMILSSVTSLTNEQIRNLKAQTDEIPSGPETIAPAD